VGFISSHHSACGTQIRRQSALCSKFRLQCYNVTNVLKRRTPHVLINDSTRFFDIYVRNKDGRSEGLKSPTEVWPTLNMNIIQRFVFRTWRHSYRLLKHFLRLKTCFLNVKPKLHATFLLLGVLYFTGLQRSQNTLSTYTLKRKLHTKQRSITAKLSTLIHNK
jgi:hypothetical protein